LPRYRAGGRRQGLVLGGLFRQKLAGAIGGDDGGGFVVEVERLRVHAGVAGRRGRCFHRFRGGQRRWKRRGFFVVFFGPVRLDVHRFRRGRGRRRRRWRWQNRGIAAFCRRARRPAGEAERVVDHTGSRFFVPVLRR